MRLFHYTIIIWMSFLHAGEGESIHFEPIDKPPVGILPHYYEPHIRPIEPIRPIHPIGEPIKPIHPVDPIHPTSPHDQPVIPRSIVSYKDPSQGQWSGSIIPKGPSDLPQLVSVPRSVQAYLSQHSQLPEALSGVELPHATGRTVEQIRVQYLEKMQKNFDENGLITIPSPVLFDVSSFLQNGVGPSLVEWMVSITDGFAFAEHLSQLSTATEAQRQQFSFSPEKKIAYETAKTALVESGQDLLTIISSLHEQLYPEIFFMRSNRPESFTEEVASGLSDSIDTIETLLKKSIDQREALVGLLCEKSSFYTEAMLSAVVDSDVGLDVWKSQEKISKQSTKVVFASYDAFMRGFFLASNINDYVQQFIGTEKGQFASVQALIAALDKIGFILDSKKIWLFNYQKVSKKMVDKILSALLKEYPGTYIPSKRFILQYCKKNRLFKSISFFIPHYDQFLIDAKTLSIDELAQKYGKSADFLRSLLNNACEVVYVLQQTNKYKEAASVNDIIRKILLKHPEVTSDIVAQVISSENVQTQALLDAQSEMFNIMVGLKNEIVALQVGQLQKSLTNFSAEISKAQVFISDSFSEVKSFFTNTAFDRMSIQTAGSRLGRTMKNVLEQLQQVVTVFEKISKVRESIPLVPSKESIQYQNAFERLESLKKDTMSFAVEVEYETTKVRQDKLSAQLLGSFQGAIKQELLPYSGNYLNNSLLDIINSLKSESFANVNAATSDEGVDILIDDIADNSILYKENEKDYQACIWASNKMAMMESKIRLMSSLLKMKKTQVFLTACKNALKNMKASFLFLSNSEKVRKCLNVMAEKSFLSQKIKDLEKQIDILQKQIDDQQNSKSFL
jgi:hypothetical protein